MLNLNVYQKKKEMSKCSCIGFEERIANCDSKHNFKYNSKPKFESNAKVT